MIREDNIRICRRKNTTSPIGITSKPPMKWPSSLPLETKKKRLRCDERVLRVKQRTRSESSIKRVGLISDTHIPTRAKEIPLKVFDLLKNVDFIIHAGDLVELKVIEKLEQLAPVLAVHGNVDRSDIREVLPVMIDLKLLNWKIGVIHDAGALYSRTRMHAIAKDNNYDVLVYGHTHRPNINWKDKRLYINPGSPTNPLPSSITKPSISILELTKKKVEPDIIPL